MPDEPELKSNAIHIWRFCAALLSKAKTYLVYLPREECEKSGLSDPVGCMN
jgi:hypothetical protein